MANIPPAKSWGKYLLNAPRPQSAAMPTIPSKFASAMQSSSPERMLGDLSSTQDEGTEGIVFTGKLGLRR
ncbi:hypothetical protein MMC22_007371 [Lobaria immixta]|nr:hypothetical protein [Lobaria immixta]